MTEDYNPYCPICTSCGEEACCSPIDCVGSGGTYCEHYLKVLKDSYKEYHKLMEFIFKDKIKYKELITELDKIWEETDER